jgi:hypothetical protein
MRLFLSAILLGALTLASATPIITNATEPAACLPDGCTCGGVYTSENRNGPYERLNLYYGLDSRDCRQFWNPIQVFWLDGGAHCKFFESVYSL